MRKHTASWVCTIALVAPAVGAQEPDQEGAAAGSSSASFSLTGDEGANAGSSTATDATAPAPAAAPDSGDLTPRAGLTELGLFSGVLAVSRAHNIHDERFFRRSYTVPAWVIGGRVAYYPSAGFGLEAEFLHGEGDSPKINGEERWAQFSSYRAHMILQAPGASVTPFLLVGGGVLTATSEFNGSDADGMIHAGLGLKIPLGRYVDMRMEAREDVTQRRERTGESAGLGVGMAFSEEYLLGFSVVLDRGAKAAPPPPPPAPPSDADGDRVPDTEDACPDVKAFSADGCPIDTDADGVNDTEDDCPREKGAAPTGCPDLDPDKDNVKLPCDKCPDEKGIEPDGCPVRDSDGDGIADDKDRCPKEAETRNGFQDDDGCPDEIPKEVKAFTGVIKGIYFDKGKATIRADSKPLLNKAVDVLKRNPSVRIEVSGHTSSEGSAESNQELSRNRALAVRQYLIDAGIDEDRVKTRGAGSDEPIGDNKTAAGREKNRRIEFKILEQ